MSDERSPGRGPAEADRVDEVLDEAIDGYPVRSLPTGLVERTMTQVRAEPRAAEASTSLSGEVNHTVFDSGIGADAQKARGIAADMAIDDAIDSYPLESLPGGFIGRTMAQVRAEPQVRAQPQTPAADGLAQPARPPRFVDGLRFLDLAVPAFASVFALAAVALAYLAWRAADPLTLAAFELEMRRAALATPPSWVEAMGAALVTAAAGLTVVAVAAAGLWIDRRRLILRRTMDARRV